MPEKYTFKILKFTHNIIFIALCIVSVIVAFYLLEKSKSPIGFFSIFIPFLFVLLWAIFIYIIRLPVIKLTNKLTDVLGSVNNMSIEKVTRATTIFGIITIALSFVYFFVYRPYHKESITKQCHQWVSDQTKNSYGNINKEFYNTKFDQCLNKYGQ